MGKYKKVKVDSSCMSGIKTFFFFSFFWAFL